jgi:rubredoxin
VQEVADIKDDRGLFVKSMIMAPGTRAAAPAPSGGDGQYVAVLKGSLVHENKERKAPAVVFVRPHEDAFQVQAGPDGLAALILNFPRVAPRSAEITVPPAAAGFKKWQCVLCAFAYDEERGLPGEGIPAGTRWADVPDTWSCPDCAAGKSDFAMVELA